MKERSNDVAPGADANLWKDSSVLREGNERSVGGAAEPDDLDRLKSLCATYPEDDIEWLLSGGTPT